MKEILVVSHCILNNASKVAQDESELAEEYRSRDALIAKVLERGVQLIQLPCPEFMLYGSKRWGHVKDQFDNPFFRSACREMLSPFIAQLKEYSANGDSFRVIGIVSVEGSPSCGMYLTCRGDWGGEPGSTGCSASEPAAQVRMTGESGAFMEELSSMLAAEELGIPVLTIDEAARAI